MKTNQHQLKPLSLSKNTRFISSFVVSAKVLVLSFIVSFSMLVTAPMSYAQDCELDREVKLSGMSYLSNMVLVETLKSLIEAGYDCDVEIQTGSVVPMLTATARGENDIQTEIWINSVAEVWSKASQKGDVVDLGPLYTGGLEGFWIPDYVAERFPNLNSVADLPRYKDEFKDPEQPNKGRFYACPAGWVCEIVIDNLFKAWGLNDDFVAYLPGTGAALDAAIESSIKRRRNIVFYYWSPTVLAGRYDLVPLDMGHYDKDIHNCNLKADCANPGKSSFPPTEIHMGANTKFIEQAPQLAKFVDAVQIPSSVVSALLAWSGQNDAEAEEVAEYFIENYPHIWLTWFGSNVDALKEAVDELL